MGVPYGLSNVNIDGLDLAAVDVDLGVKFGVTTLSGWEGASKPSLDLTNRVRSQGAIGGDSFSGPRHITVGGWIRSRDPLRILPAKDALLSAFAREERLLTVTEVGVSRWAMVRREDEPIITRKSRWYAEYSVQVAAEDSRKFGNVLTQATRLPATSGGFTYPHTYPYVIASTTVSGQVFLTNPGNETGPVTLRIDGPVKGPVVTHTAGDLKRQLQFATSLELGVGEWIDVDMENHLVLANGQSSRAGWVTQRGWSGFEPGLNTWAFTAAVFNPGAQLTVMATESWQ
ncbi:hypothetical protein LLS1_18450 [Leifsonia sp. LS1]|nr:hypothetical protein LLS1_18450 [Leifsonia sp. LS1]